MGRISTNFIGYFTTRDFIREQAIPGFLIMMLQSISYPLLTGVTVTLLVLLLSYFTAFVRAIGSWTTWCNDVRHLRSMPSPPRRWLWGNILEVSTVYLLLNYCVHGRDLQGVPCGCYFVT